MNPAFFAIEKAIISPKKPYITFYYALISVLCMVHPTTVVLYTTSCPATVKTRSDISTLKHILDAKKVRYEEVRKRSATLPGAQCPVPQALVSTLHAERFACRTACRSILQSSRAGGVKCWQRATTTTDSRSFISTAAS